MLRYIYRYKSLSNGAIHQEGLYETTRPIVTNEAIKELRASVVDMVKARFPGTEVTTMGIESLSFLHCVDEHGNVITGRL